MAKVTGSYSNGRIVLDTPTDWPEGAEVVVRLLDEDVETGEEDQGDDPESIARWLAWMDSLEPLVMTPEEEAAWQAARQADKEYELSKWDERSEKLRKMWE